jgi:hypothetical protein
MELPFRTQNLFRIFTPMRVDLIYFKEFEREFICRSACRSVAKISYETWLTTSNNKQPMGFKNASESTKFYLDAENNRSAIGKSKVFLAAFFNIEIAAAVS